MSKIREKIDIKINTKLLITFADRPDSLFKTVHQKLIIFYGLNNGISQTLTSSYLTWYKSEREMLLKNIKLHKNNFCENNFIPKIGNELEESVYSKIYNKSSLNNLRQKFTKKKFIDKDFIFLNSRATFFIKVFKHNPGSKEYKQYFIEKNETLGVIALLSSSIYFMFWSIVSDCWHITNKEFDIIIPDGLFESKKIQDLTLELLDKLEKTKKFIGSKQIDYEYKHKDCIDVIHQIDEEIYNLYYLNSLEKEYIKNYRIKYRLGQNYEQGN